ncbi:MAG: hydrogenase 4 subunit B [Methylococcaceae bacterium]|nr:hydrogenase 4 subunit B [Methylococcaceae bacterium]
MLRNVVTEFYVELREQGKNAWRRGKALVANNILTAGAAGLAALIITSYAVWAGARVSMLLALLAVLLSLASAVVSIGADRHPFLLRYASFALLGLAGVCGVCGGTIATLARVDITGEFPLGLPWLPWHLRLDALSGFFLSVIGLALIAVSLFGPHYVREYERGRRSLAVLGIATGLFVAGMELVLLAGDAFFFMIAWELMSVSSYFLVAYEHEQAANRRAAFLYLLMAEAGALFIILAFGVLAAFSDGFTFSAMREASLAPLWASIAFSLALIGFGMKAGIMPLHAWLPEAHPVAPSHISALMSGVMLKVAVYGLIRFSFDLLGELHWEWGIVVLILGSVSSVLGVLYALMQHNLKRLLAYHSVENIGIIFMGLGLSIVFYSTGHPHLGALGLVAALYHTLNHALFKSLLFLSAGTILHQTHESDIERMGGLIHGMPKTAVIFLIGCISISALPPFNGFVSEWLTFQTALQASVLESGVLRSFVPVTAAMLALTGGLAAACFVKVYGVVFLGQPRSRHVRNAHETPSNAMLAGPGFLAFLCLLFGVLPSPMVHLIEGIPFQLTGQLLPSAHASNWLWLTPISPETASYAAPLVLLAILVAWAVSYELLHPRGKEVALRKTEPWDCGFGGLTPRMQYTATAFAMPFRRLFGQSLDVDEKIEHHPPDPQHKRAARLVYNLRVGDPFWRWLYEPIGNAISRLSRQVARIQTGHVRTYLSYSFVTLIFLLWVVSR